MKKYDNDVVACRIKQLRKMNNLTQEQLAKMLGLKRISFTHYETGRTIPRSDILFELAEIFSVSTDYLYGRDNLSVENKFAKEEEAKEFKKVLADVKEIIGKVGL